MNHSLRGALTPIQIEQIFHKIILTENLKLKQLDICGGTSLAHIPADILSKALVRLESIYLVGTVLTATQIQNVLITISISKEMKLNRLSFLALDASSVPGEILVAAISRLEVVELLDTTLTSHQLTSIFQMVAIREHISIISLILLGSHTFGTRCHSVSHTFGTQCHSVRERFIIFSSERILSQF